ncbi:MAG TPA: CvpA family protein [Lachnospiraceae bacterium]|nr:CvpA family protein [Lachnospiraceae bacterium]
MNYVEIGVIVMVAVFAIRGNMKGLVGELTSFISILLAVLGMALFADIIGSSLDHQFSDAILAGIFLVVLIILMQVFRIVIVSIKIFTKLPIINGINRLLGFVLGLVEGLIVVWIIFIVISKYNIYGKSSEMIQLISDNKYLSFLYHQNILSKLFK